MLIFRSGILSQEQPGSPQGLTDVGKLVIVQLCLFRWSVLLSYRKEDVVRTAESRFCPSGLSQTEHLKGVRDWTLNMSGFCKKKQH